MNCLTYPVQEMSRYVEDLLILLKLKVDICSTTIHYQLPEEAEVHLAIYDILGQQVRNIVDRVQPGGIYQVSWNGKDDGGREVASGVYFYQLRAGAFKSVRKLVFLK